MVGKEIAKPVKPRKFTERLGEVGKLQEEIEGKRLAVKPKGKSFMDYFEEMDALAKGK